MSNSNLDPIRILKQKSYDLSLPMEAFITLQRASAYLYEQLNTEEKIARWIEGRL